MNFKRLLLFLVAPLAMVMGSCTSTEEPEYTTPKITITDEAGAEVTAINFDAEGGDKTIIIKATRGWEISKTATWFNATPASDTNLNLQEKSVEVKFTAMPNDEAARTETIKIVMDKIEKSIVVSQADAEGNVAGPQGEGTLESPYNVGRAMEIILAGSYTEDMVYTKGIISELGEDGRAQYGNYTFSISDDGTTTGQLLVYRCKYLNGKNFTTSDNLEIGDEVIVCGQLVNFKGNTPEIQSCYIASHNGFMPEPPALKEGVYASDAAFVCNIDNSNDAVYSLGDTNIGGNDVSGFKLGTGSKAGVFTSAAIGVSGDKYLNFYAVAWNGKSATLYYRVQGGDTMSQAVVANTGANNNAPYNGLVIAESDHFSVKLTGLQATDKIEFSTDASFTAAANDKSGRALVFGIKLTDEALGGEAGGEAGGNQGGDNQGGETTAPENALLWASFATDMANFTTENVELGGLDYVWYHDAQYKQMKASAFKDDVRYATESYLVSPVVTLTGAEDYYVNFEHTGKFFSNMSEQATLWVREEGGAWAQLTIPTYMTGNDWTFVNSGDIALTAYAGKNIQIGFRYTSTATDAPTWEVKNVLVAKGTAGETPENPEPENPEDPETPVIPEFPTGEEVTATITFDNTAKRTEHTSSVQVWQENGITVTNNKSASTTDIADYSNPARFYKNSEVVIAAPATITKLVIESPADGTNANQKYLTFLQNSLNGTVSVDGTTVTVVPATVSDTYTFSATAGQVRFYSVAVTYISNGSEGGETPENPGEGGGDEPDQPGEGGGEEPTPDPEQPEEPEIPVEPETLEALDANAYYVFKQATEFAPGKWYAMIADGNAATLYNGAYGRLASTATISLTDGVSLPAVCAFGFVSADGGYTIQQSDLKYLQNTGTYKTFNFEATLPTSGHIWSVSLADGVATIINTTTNRQISYSPSYKNFEANETLNTAPVLYELVEVDTNSHIVGVGVSSLSFAAEGGEKTFDITTYGDATLNVSDDAEWLTVSVADGVVTVVAAANEGEARTAEVTITFGEESMTVAVEQAAPIAEGTEVTYVWTLASGELTTAGGTVSKGEPTLDWTQSAVDYIGWDSNNGRGVQIGSSSKPAGTFTLSTSGIEGTISSIVVNASMGSSGDAALTIKVGDTAYLNGQKLTTTATDYTATVNAAGNIEISFAATKKACYLKSVTITYTK